jgi:predicted phage replisome organizer
MAKRYFWLKLKEDFFDERHVKALRRLPQGDSLVIVYLKMQLKSLKTEGIIPYEGFLPDSVAELAMALDEDENVVRLAVEALIKFRVIERWDNDALYMTALQRLIGSESDSAERVRRHRELKNDRKLLQCNAAVTSGNALETSCNTEIEIEIDIEREKEKEKREKNRADAPDGLAALSPFDEDSFSPKKGKAQKHKYGEYKNVLLTDEELDKLKSEFPDWQRRIDTLSEYIASKGVKYKSHYVTIKSWARRDAAGERKGQERQYHEKRPEERDYAGMVNPDGTWNRDFF